MSFRNSAAAARRWSEAPKRRSVAPRAADDDWEKLFADLKPLAPELSAAQVEVLERALARGRRQVPITDVAKDWKEVELADSGRDSTIGRPESPPSCTGISIGIWARRGW